MSTIIAIIFTINNQDTNKIQTVLDNIKKGLSNIELVHPFYPRTTATLKGVSVAYNDLVDSITINQKNYYDSNKDRIRLVSMFKYLAENNAYVYFVGDILTEPVSIAYALALNYIAADKLILKSL